MEDRLEILFAEDEALLIREEAIFETLLNEGKLDRYRGQHIAMLNGEVVASANVMINAAKVAYNSVGYRALLLKYVPKKGENITNILDYIESCV